HVTQPRDRDFLSVMEAHHRKTGGCAVCGVVLPHISIAHRCFLYKRYTRRTATISSKCIMILFTQDYGHILSYSARIHKRKIAPPHANPRRGPICKQKG